MIIFNASMLNKNPTGVGIYSRKLIDIISKNTTLKFKILFIAETKFMSIYRLLWNFFCLPLKAKNGDLIFSFSTHGTPFHNNQIITIHDLICLNFPEQHKFQYYYFKYLVPIILKSCRHIVAISEFTKSEIIKFYNIPAEKISVINNGANIIRYQPSEKVEQQIANITGNRPFFISVGAAYSHKNMNRLIEAIELINNKEYAFLIIGKKNEYLQNIENITINKNLHHVKFLNYVDDNLLAGLYTNAIANVYLSLYEGFGFPPLEAASVGSISIVSDIKVMREIYGDSVKYVDPLNIKAIAKGINDIIRDEEQRNLIKAKLPGLLQKYNWEEAAKLNIKLIEKFQKNNK